MLNDINSVHLSLNINHKTIQKLINFQTSGLGLICVALHHEAGQNLVF